MKFYGKIGFLDTVETDPENHPGVFEETWVERAYYGEHLSTYSSRWKNTSNLNDDVSITTRISILADPYASDNFKKIRYVDWNGALWEVSNVEVQFPRLVLSVGDLYNK